MAEQRRTGLRVLITNNTLAVRAGTEMYVRDLALALMKRGHFPVAYSPILGNVAAELRKATVPVISDLGALGVAPDIIHGHHHLDTMTALLHFPETPAIHVCHGWSPWEEAPPRFPNVRRYVAVDDLCRERLLTTPGLDSSLTETSYNFVDTARFQRRLPLPGRPTAALVFSNYASAIVENPVRAACRRFGIDRIDVVGQAAGHPVDEPESILGKYDVVFAKARCALEAMATGCAVMVTDSAGLGGLVTRENVERLRRLNFGARAIQAAPLTEGALLAQLKCYDPDDAAKVTDYIRAEADIQSAITRWEAVYAAVLDEWPRFRSDEGVDFGRKQLAAAAEYLTFLGPIIKYRAEVDRSLQTLMVENTDLLAKLAGAAAGGEPPTPPADA